MTRLIAIILFCAGIFCLAQSHAQVPMTGAGLGTPSSGAAGVTWDPANTGSDVVLSGGNLIVTATGTTNVETQTTTTHVTGKYCAELHFTGTAPGGGGTILYILRTFSTGYPDGYAIGKNPNSWLIVGSPGAVSFAGTNVGDFTMMCVDFGAKLMWNKSDTVTDWNGNASASPVTGVGGLDISPAYNGVEPFSFDVFLDGGVGEVITLNVTAATFHFSTDWIALSGAGYVAWN